MFTRYCSLNSVANLLKLVMCLSGRRMNHSSVAPDSVLISILQYTTSNPPVSIIWVWNAVRWAFGSSTPVKETFEPRDIVGKAAFMIAHENGMGRALSGTGGACSSAACSSTYCRFLRSAQFCVVHSGSCYFCLESAHRIQDLLRGYGVSSGGYPSRGSSRCLSRTYHIVGKDS